ncbi:glycosyltransferase family 2 protein [Candidatus Babeliales bacterium]|nr:glycosyltransferase family 2 protein [Candidatus Babeliales bacterium]
MNHKDEKSFFTGTARPFTDKDLIQSGAYTQHKAPFSQTMNHPAVSLVLPVYNEAESLERFFNTVFSIMNLLPYTYEFIFIDDGSSDSSWDILTMLAHKNPQVKVIQLSRNFGHQIALTAGYDYASGDAIISMDTDLQHPPELIPQLLEKWQSGYNIVYARKRNNEESFLKKYTSILYYKLLQSISSIIIPEKVADFRLIDRETHDHMQKYRGKTRYLRGLVSWTGLSFTFVDFTCQKRTAGTSGYSLKKMFSLAWDGITTFSTLPLNLSLYMGFLMLFIFPWLILWIEPSFGLAALYCTTNMTFFFIWILGAYISRIHQGELGLSLYIVQSTINLHSY